MEDEISKYRKKRDSSTSKSKSKSKHKHTYEPCLVRVVNPISTLNGHMEGASYCTICGKVVGSILGYDAVRGDKYWRGLTEEELLEKYKGYEMFDIDEFGAEYVPIVKERSNT